MGWCLQELHILTFFHMYQYHHPQEAPELNFLALRTDCVIQMPTLLFNFEKNFNTCLSNPRNFNNAYNHTL